MRNVLPTPRACWSISVAGPHWLQSKESTSPSGTCFPQYLWLLLTHPFLLLCPWSLFNPAPNSYWRPQPPPLRAWFGLALEHWGTVLYGRCLQTFSEFLLVCQLPLGWGQLQLNLFTFSTLSTKSRTSSAPVNLIEVMLIWRPTKR